MLSLLKRWPALAALMLATPPVLAAPPAPPHLRCGQYVSANGEVTLAIDTPTRGRRVADGVEVTPLVVDTADSILVLVDLDDGVSVPVTVSADGTRINDTQQTYQLRRETAACQTAAQFPDTQCLHDAARCMARLHVASAPALLDMCQQGVGAACSALLQAYVDGALVEVTRGRPFARGIDPPEVALPAPQRGQLQQLCVTQRSGRFCTEVAAQQLTARDLPAALQALQVVCDAGRQSACERVEPLRALGDALRLVAATEVPCGRYQADGGSLDTLTFDEAGRAKIDTHDVRVLLLDGTLHLRHDTGADYVLGLLANGDLLGLDAWTGYQRYRRPPGDPRFCR